MTRASTVPGLLRARAETWPERELVRFEGASATYAEVEERSNRWATALAGLGVERGDRVAVVLPNGLAWPVVALAAWKRGAIVVPVNVGYGTRDLAHVLRDSGARLALAGGEARSLIEAVRPDVGSLDRVAAIDDLDGSAPRSPPGADGPDGADPATLQYTSGTTGFPKGCTLSHRYWLELGRTVSEHAGLSPEDVLLTAQPFYYMDPTWNLVASMWVGAPLVILPRFSASTFWRSVKENGATFFYCLGTMPVYLFKQPVRPDWERGHDVRLVLCSGIPPKLHGEFERRWGCPWREVYGATELGGPIGVPIDDADCVGSGAMGGELPGYEARVVGPDGVTVPDGEVGELHVRGGTMMNGYWGNLEATHAWKPDGWARTGDLVYRDPRGHFHIVGRLKDMIRRGGENIAAVEVEAVLAEHPAVLAAACVAIPDDERGEEVKAFVKVVGGDPPPAAELLAFAAERLARFKVPRYVEYVDELPLTPSEKIAKHELPTDRASLGARTYDARQEFRP